MFDSPISNNKENKNVAPHPSWTPLATKYFFEFLNMEIFISLIYMEILAFKFERPISINKEKKMFAPPPLLGQYGKKIYPPTADTPLTKKNIFFYFLK